jgi:hypothetical protein
LAESPITFLPVRRFGETTRRDSWWLPSVATFLGFSAFIVYATWAGYSNAYYEHGPYLSPMYSPLLFGPSPHAWFGGPEVPAWWPGILPYSGAALVVWAPLSFRITCYYYRGAYYKSFWADPPGCTVGEPRKRYLGERSFPLIIQNVHRYTLYLALVFIVILASDAWKAMWFTGADGAGHFGVGVGTLVLIINPILIAGYTFGCHSLRHLVGGGRDVLASRPVQKTAYDCVSCLNRGHMRWAWASLIWVGFTDLYVRMCAMGVWHDWRIL